MRRASLAVLLIGGLMVAGTSAANAQHGGFNAKSFRIGPVIGLGGIGDAGISFGGRLEKGLKELPNLGNGILSIEGGADYYSWNYGVGNGYKWSNLAISGTVNYHINTKSEKFGVFVGAGLGYENWSASCPSSVGNLCGGTYSSGIYFVGRLGGTYALAKALQLYAEAGAGAATLNAGVMFNFGGN